jgi:hypothetical protein
MLAALAPTGTFSDTWYSSSWQFRQRIFINLDFALSGSLNNLPGLAKNATANPAGGSAVFSQAKTSGYVLFSAFDGITQLAHEIKMYAPVGQDLWAQVIEPTLSSSGTITIDMHYGNPGSSNQHNPTAVWDSNSVTVLHQNQQATAGRSGAIFYYSTANGSNGAQQDLVAV